MAGWLAVGAALAVCWFFIWSMCRMAADADRATEAEQGGSVSAVVRVPVDCGDATPTPSAVSGDDVKVRLLASNHQQPERSSGSQDKQALENIQTSFKFPALPPSESGPSLFAAFVLECFALYSLTRSWRRPWWFLLMQGSVIALMGIAIHTYVGPLD